MTASLGSRIPVDDIHNQYITFPLKKGLLLLRLAAPNRESENNINILLIHSFVDIFGILDVIRNPNHLVIRGNQTFSKFRSEYSGFMVLLKLINAVLKEYLN